MINLIIVTGFLGSGKTTLLKRILAGQNTKKFALIINELGAVKADEQILCELAAPSALLNDGCLCCKRLDELAASVRKICEENDSALRYIIIETTGLANIAPIANTLLRDVFCAARLRLFKVICVVSALEWREHFLASEAIAQLAAASTVLLSKIDLADASDIEQCSAKIKEINPLAKLILASEFSAKELEQAADFTGVKIEANSSDLSAHTARVQTLVLRFGSVSFERLSVWLAALLHCHGTKILRIKGVLATPDGGVAINGVLHHIYPAEHIAFTPQVSELALIFSELDLNALRKSFERHCCVRLI